MFDKNELQDLLVRLQLGTLSLETAIDEIYKQYSGIVGEEYREIWKRTRFGFGEVIFAAEIDKASLTARIEELLSKRSDFIAVGIDAESIAELAKRFPDVLLNYKAGVATYISKKRKQSNGFVGIITGGSSRAETAAAEEAATVLEFAGITVSKYTDMRARSILDINAMKHALKDAEAVLAIADEDAHHISLAASLVSVPIVVLDVSGNSASSALRGLDGVLRTADADAFAASMAILRILD